MKRGAIFDMDGTLIDTEKVYRKFWLETADVFGVERKPELAVAMSGSGLSEMPPIISRFYPNIDANAYVQKVLERVMEFFKTDLEVKPGVEEILQYFLENKIPMAVASSADIFAVEDRVKRLHWENYFSALVGGDQVENGKPAPDIFLLAAEKLNIPAADCYVFEDSFNGVRAGAASKAATIMVIDCAEPTEEIRSLCAGVYDSMSEAQAAIQRGEV